MRRYAFSRSGTRRCSGPNAKRQQAAIREAEIRADSKKTPAEKHTLFDALRKYSDEVSTKKEGKIKEQVRLVAFERLLPVNKPIGEITTTELARWRDDRLKVVKPGSVIRDFTLLSHVFEVARREWQWIAINPISDVLRPPSPEHRKRVISSREIRLMLRAMNYDRKPVRSITGVVARCFLIALRTGMRAGEICSLPWEKTYSDYASVIGKTGRRDIPLTPKTLRIIEQLRGWDDVMVAGIQTSTLDALFRKYRAKAGLSGFTFHDTRHTAATWLAQHLHVLDLCKVFGWTNPQRAMVYYNPTASDISKRLAARRVPGQLPR